MPPPLPLTPTTRLVRSNEVLASTIRTEAVMMSLAHNAYFTLDAVGTAVWDLLEQPRTLDELCHLLGERYAVDADTCRRDVTAFVERLAASQLVEASPA